MKQFFTTSLLLILSSFCIYGQKSASRNPTTKTLYIKVHSSEGENISDADVRVNNTVVLLDTTYKCYTVTDTSGAFIIKITKGGYEPFLGKIESNQPSYELRVYLMRPSDKYYYDMVKMAYVPHNQLLLVYPSSDTLKSYLQSLHLKYKEYDRALGKEQLESLNDYYVFAGKPDFSKTLLVYKEDSSFFADSDCIELKKIREFINVYAAGPLIIHSKNIDSAQLFMTYGNEFSVYFEPDATLGADIGTMRFDKFLKFLSGLNIHQSQLNSYQDKCFNGCMIKLDESMNTGMINMIEEVKKYANVNYVAQWPITYLFSPTYFNGRNWQHREPYTLTLPNPTKWEEREK